MSILLEKAHSGITTLQQKFHEKVDPFWGRHKSDIKIAAVLAGGAALFGIAVISAAALSLTITIVLASSAHVVVGLIALFALGYLSVAALAHAIFLKTQVKSVQ